MSIPLSTNIAVGVNKPVDNKYGPYPTKQEALDNITTNLRYKGLTVGLLSGGSVTEYWWRDGITNDDLELKKGDTASFIESQPSPDSINYMRRLTQAEYDSLFDSPETWQADTIYVIVG